MADSPSTRTAHDSLHDRNVLVAGGAGAVGEGIVRQLLEAGATVLVPSRSEGSLAALHDRLAEPERLHTLVGDIGDVDSAHQLRGEVAALCDSTPSGQLDGVVASLGGWWQGADLVDMSLDDWQAVLQGGLTAHLVAARTFLPLLEPSGGVYVMINGGAALQPVPSSGAISIIAAGQTMMTRVLAAESSAARVHSLLLETPIITRTRPDGPDAWLTADEVGRYTARLVSSDGASAETLLRFGDRAQLDAFA